MELTVYSPVLADSLVGGQGTEGASLLAAMELELTVHNPVLAGSVVGGQGTEGASLLAAME